MNKIRPNPFFPSEVKSLSRELGVLWRELSNAVNELITNSGGTTATIWEKIETKSIAAANTVIFTFDRSLYSEFKFVVDGAQPSSDAVNLRMFVGYSGTYPTAESSLLSHGVSVTDSNAVSGNVGNAATEYCNCEITLKLPASSVTSGYAYESFATWKNSSGNSESSIIWAVHTGSAARSWNSVRFQWPDASNFVATGTITMYGLTR